MSKNTDVSGVDLTTTELVRFEEYIELPDDDEGCWIWTGTLSMSSSGYPHARFWLRGRYRSAQRLAYEIFNQTKMPLGIGFRRSCDNGTCVNPEHVLIGSESEPHTTKVRRPSKVQPVQPPQEQEEFIPRRGTWSKKLGYDPNVVCVHGHLRSEWGTFYRGKPICRRCISAARKRHRDRVKADTPNIQIGKKRKKPWEERARDYLDK